MFICSAQKAGFLSEAHHEEVDQADPFYAHCKVHSDKTLIKHRKRNYNALLVQMKRHQLDLELKKNEKPTTEEERIERKLKKHRIKYTTNKTTRIEPWGELQSFQSIFKTNFYFFFVLVPTQKMPRLLTTSASAFKKLMKKAELMGIDAAALEFQEAQVNLNRNLASSLLLIIVSISFSDCITYRHTQEVAHSSSLQH